ncbi:uncharacterized protein LOC131891647 [Tigriopus californicus]|uniref:uncharacterized protein LOC131891647 n=1 Tax=Tigriopus californicus TaxID=6832 RepID=UPI0027DA3F89|nr:uncharacterized protein LOC131891647 [Tigriopus californicus]
MNGDNDIDMNFAGNMEVALPPIGPAVRGEAGHTHLMAHIRQPDSLKLNCALQILKWFHGIADRIERQHGDKSCEQMFLVGVQGEISKPAEDRDYSYFLAKIQEVRDFLAQSLVQSALEDLVRTALDIYNRFDNRRRMGVEIMVLAMMLNKHSNWFEIPDKYHSPTFVLEMLVSCRHRFQKPNKCYFWSRQSQRLLSCAFMQTRHLTKLKLAIVNDHLLKALAIHCRHLQELEVQFAMDVTEEGLYALAGKSKKNRDQGKPEASPYAYQLHRDFGRPKEWFIKDSLLFTSPTALCSVGRAYSDILPEFFETGFGCKDLVKLRINGDFIFPPLARRYEKSQIAGKPQKGPILENGFYVILLSLTKLKSLTMPGLPMVIARLGKVCRWQTLNKINIPIQSLKLDRDLLFHNEFDTLALVCKNITEISNVSPECSKDFGDFNNVGGTLYDRHFSPEVCSFLKKFQSLQVFRGRMTLPCFNSFLRLRGTQIRKIQLTTTVTSMADLVTFRKYVPNLQVFEGRVHVSVNSSSPFQGSSSPHPNQHNPVLSHLLSHKDEESSLWEAKGIPGSFSTELLDLLEKYPLSKLLKIDVEGRMTIPVMQLLAGNAEFLEDLYITNSPMNGDAKALNDEWLEALVHVNHLKSIKNLTLRMDNDQVVESGCFSERGLTKFLHHCLRSSPKLTELTGEFTRIPDKILRAKTDSFVQKGLRRLRVRNAVPYRRFENVHDSERFYGMNEGYQNMVHNQPFQLYHHPFPVPHVPEEQRNNEAGPVRGSSSANQNLHRRFQGYVFRPYPKPPVVGGSESD